MFANTRSTGWEKLMIAHISIGVRNIDISKRFYDAALEPFGYKCLRAARSLKRVTEEDR